MSKIITSFVFVAASLVCSFAGAQELLTNPDLEEVPNAPPGWELLETGGNPPSPREAATQETFADFDGGGLGLWLEAFQGLFFGNNAEPVSAVLSQTVPFSGVAGDTYTFTGYSRFETGYSGGVETLDPSSPVGEVESPTESMFELAFLNAGGNVIGTPETLDLRTEQMNDDQWVQHTLSDMAPAGTTSVRVTASATDMVPNLPAGPMSAFYDTFSLRAASNAGTELLDNADLTDAPPQIAVGWDTLIPPSYQSFSAHSGGTGFWLTAYAANPEPLDQTLLQTVPATAGTTYTFSGWSKFELGFSGGVDTLDPGSPYGEVPSLTETFFVMEFLDESGAEIDSETLDLRTVQMNDATFREHFLTAVAPAGTEEVRVGVRIEDLMTNVDIPFMSANFDDFSLVALTPGDFDGDGDADGADFLAWQQNFGKTTGAVQAEGDSDDDGDVDSIDLAAWKAAFGAGAIAAAGAVPEPTGLVAMLLGIACLPARRRAG